MEPFSASEPVYGTAVAVIINEAKCESKKKKKTKKEEERKKQNKYTRSNQIRERTFFFRSRLQNIIVESVIINELECLYRSDENNKAMAINKQNRAKIV